MSICLGMDISSKFTALAIVKKENEILVVRRNDWPEGNNLSFPGGKRQGAELPNDTARRELLEETGAFVNADQFVTLGNRIHEKTGENLFYIGWNFQNCSENPENKEPEKHSFVGFIGIDQFVEEVGEENIFPQALRFLCP